MRVKRASRRDRGRPGSLVLRGCLWAVPALFLGIAGCSLGQGEGAVHSDALYVAECSQPSELSCPSSDGTTDVGCDNYDLLPDFFAAVPYREQILITIQRGSDISELSDGLAVLVSDIEVIRSAIDKKRKLAMAAGATEEEALQEYVEVPVGLPTGIDPPGSPETPRPPCDRKAQLCTAQPVAVSLYLQKSCHNQNSVLYAVSGYIRFRSLFSGDLNEKSAAEKLTDGELDVVIGDPRDVPPGEPIDGDAIPAKLTSRLTGYFRFYFERGKPAQPFPG